MPDFDKLKEGCPWRFKGRIFYSTLKNDWERCCSAQITEDDPWPECREDTCAVYHFLNGSTK